MIGTLVARRAITKAFRALDHPVEGLKELLGA